jgi:glutamate N-acetyltransferase/amino-acid N-acetyltransferase
VKAIEGSICAPRGFRAGGICCGIKAGAVKRDLALVASDHPCTAAAVFTANLVKAANILVSREHCNAGRIRALIANSGNANACTGEAGLVTARRMAALAAEQLGIAPEETAVASTGVIGVPLPLEKIEAGIKELAASLDEGSRGADAALEAIMTTDTRKKYAAGEITLAAGHESGAGTAVRIGAMVKGSGMIHPNMATMIGIITTDLNINRELLDKSLRRAVNRSFNRLTIDGDMSTNDMVLIMANGAAGNVCIESEGADYDRFADALESICVTLVRAMARDGEGATRLLTVTVRGASSEEEAAVLAKSVAGSSLVKAACFGADANWGRVLCALGYAGVRFDPAAVAVHFSSGAGRIQLCRNGASLPFSEEEAKKILSKEEIEIEVDLDGAGQGTASAYGCDLTYDYVKINGDYRS